MREGRTSRRLLAAAAAITVVLSACLAVWTSVRSPDEILDAGDPTNEAKQREERERKRDQARAARARAALEKGDLEAASTLAGGIAEQDPALAKEIGARILERANEAADRWDLVESRRLLELSRRVLRTAPERLGAEMDLSLLEQREHEAAQLLAAAEAAREEGDLPWAKKLAEQILAEAAPPDVGEKARGLIDEVNERLAGAASREATLARFRELIERGKIAEAGQTLRDYSRTSGDRSLNDHLEAIEGLEEAGGLTAYLPVRRALLWLRAHQDEKDGAFHTKTYRDKCKNEGCGPARNSSAHDAALTGLALLAYTGFRELDVLGEFGDSANRAAKWLASQVGRNGLVGQAGSHYYTEAIVALSLLERQIAGVATREEKNSARSIVRHLSNAWVLGGGWRYGPASRDADVSVTCWVLQALHAGKTAGLDGTDQAVSQALDYLDQATDQEGLTHYTQVGSGRTLSMTPAALLARFLFGQSREDSFVAKGIEYVAKSRPAGSLRRDGERSGRADRDTASLYTGGVSFYRWYYETYALKLAGGQEWEAYGPSLEKALVATQEEEGHETGSWDPISKYSGWGGRIYCTALNALTLEVYYRHKAGLTVSGEKK